MSFTTDIDFRDVTTPDTLCFHLHLHSGKFARIAQKISDRAFKGGTLRVGGVDGFYAEWSPEISTSHIKVLTSHKEQTVDLPEGCSIVPPRLGKVAEMELRLYGEKVFSLPTATDTQDDLTLVEADEVPASFSPLTPPALDPKVMPLLKSIKAAAWVIALLLVLALFKRA